MKAIDKFLKSEVEQQALIGIVIVAAIFGGGQLALMFIADIIGKIIN